MGGFIGSCLGSCAATTLCSACNSCAPQTNNACYHYTFLTLIASIFAIILQMFGDRNIGGITICGLLFHEENCVDNASPFRILSTLSWFFIIHIGITRIWASFHKAFWLTKLILYTVTVIITYFISNAFFEGYAVFGIIGAAIFIVLQIVVFINMCYDWNETWISREWFGQTIVVTVLMYACAGVLYGFGFKRYGLDGCSSNQANLACSIIAAVLLTLVSIYAPHGAILPSAGVTLYLSWILFSGMAYVEDDSCNSGKPNDYIKIISMAILCVGVGYFCSSNYSQSDSGIEDVDSSSKKRTNSVSETGENKEDIDVEKEDDQDCANDVTEIKMVKDDVEIDESENENDPGSLCNPSDSIQAKNIHFYILMFFGCLYIMMVMTKWETTAAHSSNNGKSDKVVTANICAHWFAALLYLITLVAPLICPNRFVGDEEDDA